VSIPTQSFSDTPVSTGSFFIWYMTLGPHTYVLTNSCLNSQ